MFLFCTNVKQEMCNEFSTKYLKGKNTAEMQACFFRDLQLPNTRRRGSSTPMLSIYICSNSSHQSSVMHIFRQSPPL